MGAEPPFIYDKSSNYTFSGATNLGFNPKAATQAAWAPKQPKPKPDGPLINSKELNRHPDSYFIVPYGNLDWKPMSPHTKTIVKWVRILQLLLRVFAFLGAAGLLVFVICIKPVGNTLDWVIRIPPGIALIHLTYAIYHLSRSAKGRTPGSSASYSIFAAIVDAGLIPFFTLTALLAHNQLYGSPDTDEPKWATLFGTDMQTYIIVQSTYQISLVDGSLLLTSLIVSIYLAITFRRISKLPPDMNPLEDNLTSRHKRNKSSLSTAISEPSNRDSAIPLMSPSRSVPFAHTRNDSSSNLSSPQRRAAASTRGSRIDLAEDLYQQPKSQRSSRIDLLSTSRPASTLNMDHSRFQTRNSPGRPDSAIYSERHQSPVRPRSTVYADFYRDSPRPSSNRPPSSEYTCVEQDADENWISHPSPTSSPSPPRFAPPELQHLRNFDREQSHRASPPPPVKLFKYDKHDYSNRSPRPLGMNPPTPMDPEHRRSVEARALQTSSGNADGRYRSPPVWQDIQLDHNGSPSSEVLKLSPGRRPGKVYGDLHTGSAGGRPQKEVGRTVSSGVDAMNIGLDSAIRARDVSGKVAEEGRGRINYMDF